MGICASLVIAAGGEGRGRAAGSEEAAAPLASRGARLAGARAATRGLPPATRGLYLWRSMSPNSTARMAAWVRSETPSFLMARCT